MFWGCDMLKTVTIPSSVEYISFGAFGMCDNLKDVYYGGTPAQWNNITIDEENDVLKKVKIHCQ
jgi:hypothetical protein